MKGKLKHSTVFENPYIKEDYACAIQEELKVLIKAMIKAQEELGLDNVRVIGRILIMKNKKFDLKSFPENLIKRETFS